MSESLTMDSDKRERVICLSCSLLRGVPVLPVARCQEREHALLSEAVWERDYSLDRLPVASPDGYLAAGFIPRVRHGWPGRRREGRMASW